MKADNDISEQREFEFLDKIRVSEIEKISEPREWSPRNGRSMWILEIDFKNGDYVKFFGNTIADCNFFSKGQKYIYQIKRTTIIPEEGKPRTSNKFQFIRHQLPEKVESRLKWVDQYHFQIPQAAKMAIDSFGPGEYTQTEFLDRASNILEWMKNSLVNIDFGEKQGEDFDTFMKSNEDLFA